MYNLNKMNVLIVDDNQPIRMLIRSLLLDLGVGAVEMAASGAEAWQVYRYSKPDIILLDWHLDDMSGLEVTKRIRRDPDSPRPHIPIVMTTGFTTRENVEKARDVGITEFLVKPFTVKGLARHIEHIIEKPRDFIVSTGYVGPDRRRKLMEFEEGFMKRRDDPPEKSAKIHEDDDIYDWG